VRGNLINMYKYITGGSKEDRGKLFSAVPNDRMRVKWHKLKHSMFHLNIIIPFLL